MAITVGPLKFDYAILQSDAEFILGKLTDALLIRFTNNQNYVDSSNDGWHAVICDTFQNMDSYSMNTRSKIRRGLRQCNVRKIDCELLAEQGYDVFISAFSKYKGVKKPTITRSDFKKKIMFSKEFGDIIDYWGIFKEDNKERRMRIDSVTGKVD